MHKHNQFQVRVKPEFLEQVIEAIERSGMERWRYLDLVIEDILGPDASGYACGENPPNRKGMSLDYWRAYNRVPFILTFLGISALRQVAERQGCTITQLLRSALTQRVGLDPEQVQHPQRSEAGMGMRKRGT